MRNPNWSAEEVKTLRDAAAEGLCAGDIAKRLPGRNRVAVIGKADREGIKLHFTPHDGYKRGRQCPPWTKEQEQFCMEAMKLGLEDAEIVDALNEKFDLDRSVSGLQSRRSARKWPVVRPRSTVKRKARPRRPAHVEHPPSLNIPLLDLKLRQCRWPHGDPQHPDFAFCGQPAIEPYGYCQPHQFIGTQERRVA